MNIKQILEKNENGNYKLSEEERIKAIDSIDDVFNKKSNVLEIAKTLSDKNRITALSKLPYYDRKEVIDSLSDKDKVEMIVKVDDIKEKLSIIRLIKESKELEESLKYIPEIDDYDREDILLKKIQNKYVLSDSFRLNQLSLLKRINYRLNVAKTITDPILLEKALTMFEDDENEFYKYQIALNKNENNEYVLNEEQRLEVLKYFKNNSSICKIAMTLSDKNKIKTFDKFTGNYKDVELKKLLNSVENSDVLKEGIKKIDSDEIKKEFIDKFDDSIKLELLPFISKEQYKFEIANAFNDATLLKKSLETIENEFDKKKLILKKNETGEYLLDNQTRFNLISSISNKDLKSNIALSLEDNQLLFQSLKLIHDEYYNEPIIFKTKENGDFYLTEEQRIEIINSLDNEKSASFMRKIAMTLSDENKLKVFKKINYFNEIILSIKDINLLKMALKDIKNNDSLKIELCQKYDDKIKLEIIPYIETDEDKAKAAKLIKDPKLLIESLKFIDGGMYKKWIILLKNNKNDYILDEKTRFDCIKVFNNENHDFNRYCVAKTLNNPKYLKDSLKLFKEPYFIEKVIQLISDLKIQKECLLDIINGSIDLRNTNFLHDIIIYKSIISDINSKEKEVESISDKKEFDKAFSELFGFGSKYRVLLSDNPNIDDKIILDFIDEIKNENDKLPIFLKLTEENKMKYYNANPFELDENITQFVYSLSKENIIKYKKDLNKVFDDGCYQLLDVIDKELIEKLFDSKKTKVLFESKEIKNKKVKEHFCNYIKQHFTEIDEQHISSISKLVFEIDTSNSEELSKQADGFIDSLLSSDNPFESFKKVEQIFLKNHLPYVAKVYLTFLTVHPDFKSYKFNKRCNGNVSSPVLNNISSRGRKIVVLSDLLKNTIESNSIDFVNYINKLERANELYIKNKNSKFEDLDEANQILLIEFRDSLLTIYGNTIYNKNIEYEGKGNPIVDINKIEELYPKASNKANLLSDRIISSFCHYVGIDTIEEAKNYMKYIQKEANERNIERYNNHDFTINKGDFIKGFDINYFYDMLQTGINAHDYLGANMLTDRTALDTDLSRIWKDTTNMSISDIIDNKDTDTGHFGQAYIVIKDDPKKINITRISENEEGSRLDDYKQSIFGKKIEAFLNSSGKNISNSYGIRTGFSSSNIDYIIFDEQGGQYKGNIYKLTIPLALSGIYIPIISKKTNEVLFSVEQYNKLREKMSGLKQYRMYDYQISENIDNEIYRNISNEIESSNINIQEVKTKISKIIQEGLDNKYTIIDHINGKLTSNELQVLDTGSTGRCTNIPYDGDFDYIVRINRNIDINNNLKNEFIEKLLSKFNIIDKGKIINGDIKGMVVEIDGKEYPLDLSFTIKTNKVSYSTEMCVKDRLNTIKEKYPNKYKLVLANIIYAKELLKKNECYKKGNYGQGGLGGIGVENWILQNGGSLYDAAKEFLSYAIEDNKQIDFVTFINKYQIWDYGENFYTERQNRISNHKDNLHDNFIANNLTESGYKKMVSVLNEFVKNYEQGYIENLEVNNKIR